MFQSTPPVVSMVECNDHVAEHGDNFDNAAVDRRLTMSLPEFPLGDCVWWMLLETGARLRRSPEALALRFAWAINGWAASNEMPMGRDVNSMAVVMQFLAFAHPTAETFCSSVCELREQIAVMQGMPDEGLVLATVGRAVLGDTDIPLRVEVDEALRRAVAAGDDEAALEGVRRAAPAGSDFAFVQCVDQMPFRLFLSRLRGVDPVVVHDILRDCIGTGFGLQGVAEEQKADEVMEGSVHTTATDLSEPDSLALDAEEDEEDEYRHPPSAEVTKTMWSRMELVLPRLHGCSLRRAFHNFGAAVGHPVFAPWERQGTAAAVLRIRWV